MKMYFPKSYFFFVPPAAGLAVGLPPFCAI
jgi:hypothetical protein